MSETARVRKLIALLHKSTGQVIKHRPRTLVKNSSAVVELEFERSLCLELYKDCKELGRFMLRSKGTTVAAGMVILVSILLLLFIVKDSRIPSLYALRIVKGE